MHNFRMDPTLSFPSTYIHDDLALFQSAILKKANIMATQRFHLKELDLDLYHHLIFTTTSFSKFFRASPKTKRRRYGRNAARN